jgi:hypothetical protein
MRSEAVLGIYTAHLVVGYVTLAALTLGVRTIVF